MPRNNTPEPFTEGFPEHTLTPAEKEAREVGIDRLAEGFKKPVPGLQHALARERRNGYDSGDLSKGGSIDPTEYYNDAGTDRVLIRLVPDNINEKNGEVGDMDVRMAEVPDARIVTHKNGTRAGQPVRDKDTVFVSYPRAYEEEYRRFEANRAKSFEKNPKQALAEAREALGFPPEQDRNDPDEKQRLAEFREEQYARSADSSPTKGLSLQEGVRQQGGKSVTRAMQDHARQTGQLGGGYDSDDVAAIEARIKDAVSEGRKANARGSNTFGGLTGRADRRPPTTGDRNVAARLAKLEAALDAR